MQYRDIITKSWDLTKTHSYLNWLAAIPLALEFIIATVYIPLRWGMYFVPDILSRTYHFVEQQYFLHQTETTTFLLIFVATIILNILVPTFCEGALIGTIAKILHSDENAVKKQFSIAYGLNVYLPLVELHAMTSALNPMYVFIGMSLLHHFNAPIFNLFFWPALGLFIIEIIINLSVIYSKYELIIHRSGVLASMRKSIKIVIFHLTETFFLLMLLLLIVIRAVVNLLIVFLIPILIYSLSTYLVSFVAGKTIFYVLVAIGGLALYYYALKTASMLGVFVSFTFVLTFLELSSREEDVIIKSEPVSAINPNQNFGDNSGALEFIGKSLLKEMEKIQNDKIKDRLYTVEEIKPQIVEGSPKGQEIVHLSATDKDTNINNTIVKDTFGLQNEDLIETEGEENDDITDI